jgi:hypothetical protein
MCSFTDTQGTLGSYTAPSTYGFTPSFWYWPSNIAHNGGPLLTDVSYNNPSIVSVNGISSPIFSLLCEPGPAPKSSRSPILIQCPFTTNAFEGSVFYSQQGTTANSKGRINLGNFPNAPNDWVTLYDSNWGKTTATDGHRPSADNGDSGIGAATTGDITLHAATTLSRNINSLPGASPTEQLSSTLDTLSVPLMVTGNVTLSGHLNQNATGDWAGTCAMASGTSCTISILATYAHPVCVAQVQGLTPIASACSVSGTTITITAATSNSATWGAMLFGNPN